MADLKANLVCSLKTLENQLRSALVSFSILAREHTPLEDKDIVMLHHLNQCTKAALEALEQNIQYDSKR
jgi:hypothetical protein